MLGVRGMRNVMEKTDEWWRLSCGHKIVPTSDQRSRCRTAAICKECRQAKLAPKQRETARLRRRREMGRCWDCEEPAAEGRSHCQKHLDYHARRYRERAAAGQ